MKTQEAKTSKKAITRNFPIQGMTCASCASSVESMLKAQKGVEDAAANFAGNTALVTYDPEVTEINDLKNAISSIGYQLIVEDDDASKEKLEELKEQEFKKLKRKTLLSILFTLPVVVIGMFFMDMPYGNYIMWALTTPVLLIFGQRFFVNAWKQARHGKANMDTLVALSTGIAYIFSVFNTLFPEFWINRGLEAHVYFEAAAVITSFILLGKWLEEKAKSNTGNAIKKLMGLQPKSVNVLTAEGVEKTIPVSEVVPGDIILVKPGDKIPIDGEVISGSSFVDESMISGEPVPVEKISGEKVYAGTINQKGSFRFKAEKVGSDTVLARIIQMVEQAQGSKAPVQQFVDKVAGIFVPVVIAIAILSFIVWAIAGGENALTQGLLAMITILVIACPCALGLATPTAIMVGIGKGAENGILIKDADSLEKSRKINAIILDKTGTITEGKPVVTDIRWFKDDKSDLEHVLYLIERESEHPLAEAVVEILKGSTNGNQNLDKFESITGRGVHAVYEGNDFYVGNEKLMQEKDVQYPGSVSTLFTEWSQLAKTVIFFANKNKVLALIAIEDKVKETSAPAIMELESQGIDVYMLTGDNEKTATAVAKATGIKHYKAETLPSDKADFVKKLQEEGKVVAMVGDGINDAHALAQADVSIAMGQGSDIAMDVAMMTIISNDLRKVPMALKLSRKTVKTINQNLFWAFIYNIIGIPIAAGILYPFTGFLLNPMIAGAAMALSSVSVVSNSLRLRYARLGSSITNNPKSTDNQNVESETIKDKNTNPNLINENSQEIMKTYKYKTNINCSGCVSAVTPHLNNVEGIENWQVDTDNPEKTLTVTSNSDSEDIEKAVKKAGFEITEK